MKVVAVKRPARPERGTGISGRFGIRVGIERSVGNRAASRPKSAAAHFVRVGLSSHPVRQIRNAARMYWGFAAGKPGDGKVRSTPEEVHGAALASEAGTKLFKDAVGLHQDAPEPAGILSIVCPVSFVLVETYRIGHLVRLARNAGV